jgi:hypothetical protein
MYIVPVLLKVSIIYDSSLLWLEEKGQLFLEQFLAILSLLFSDVYLQRLN